MRNETEMMRRMLKIEKEIERLRAAEYTTQNRFDGCRVYRTTNQSITAGSTVQITWEAENWDTAGMWTSGTDITVPGPGLYVVVLGVRWAATADSTFNWEMIYLDGSSRSKRIHASANDILDHRITDIVQVTGSSGVITGRVQKNTGSAQNILSGTNFTYMAVARLPRIGF
jgi:hypothetical protein